MIDLRTLSFLWPILLWLLAIVPLAALAMLLLRFTRSRAHSRYPGMVPQALTHSGVWGFLGRYGPGLVALIGLALLLIAVARPRAMLLMPTAVETVILAIDTSGSMRAADVKPSRIEAAQAAARSFIDGMPSRLRVGVVTISGTAAVTQPPTTERDDLYQAIDSLQLQRGSAIGSGILVSLAELLPGAGIDVQKILNEASGEAPRPGPSGTPLRGAPGRDGTGAPGATTPGARSGTQEPPKASPPAEPGSNRSAAIILLTDGQGNTGPDTLKMAELAAQHGVRIFTVGVGTPEGITLNAQGMSMRVRLDEEALKKIADITLGDYFRANDALDLRRIYKELSSRLTLERRQLTEVTAVFALAGCFLVIVAAAVSLARTGRIA
ncbi:MAG: VWA domain-containing protein [Betaproteobacteria bacterium]|nr:VWA domain-containing protein [Betaproteobacteria bacterium]